LEDEGFYGAGTDADPTLIPDRCPS
jgi:hypothetical protein